MKHWRSARSFWSEGIPFNEPHAEDSTTSATVTWSCALDSAWGKSANSTASGAFSVGSVLVSVSSVPNTHQPLLITTCDRGVGPVPCPGSASDFLRASQIMTPIANSPRIEVTQPKTTVLILFMSQGEDDPADEELSTKPKNSSMNRSEPNDWGLVDRYQCTLYQWLAYTFRAKVFHLPSIAQ